MLSSAGEVNYDSLMQFSWNLFIDFGLVGGALLLATIVRYRVRFFQRYLIPNALTAGFLLLPIYNYLLPLIGLNADNLGDMVYHLLSISFIAMTLRADSSGAREKDGRIFATSLATLSQFGIQAFVGLLFTFVAIVTVRPDLFPSFGFLLPLGFVQGPGQAYAIGTGWERFGFEGAGSIGLTFAAMGFIFSSFGGVFLINLGIKRKWVGKEISSTIGSSAMKSGIYPSRRRRPVGLHMTTESEAIDTLSFHVALVFFVYVLSYLLLLGITRGLSMIGPMFADLATNLWGINFIFSAFTAILVRMYLRGRGWDYAIDSRTLTRISGLAVDFMVASAIGAISLVVVWRYAVPIVTLSLIAGLLALVLVPWFCSRIFKDHQFLRTLMIFGVSTGTLPTGLALLRVLDPEFETPVANDYMYSSGITFLFAIPLVLAINLPAYAATTGNMWYFWAGMGVSLAYILFVFTAFFVIARRRALSQPHHVWLRREESLT